MKHFNDCAKAFNILNMEPVADQDMIRKKALDLLRVHHPDKSALESANQITLDINWARDFLRNCSDEELQDFVKHNQAQSKKGLVSG